MLTAINNFYKHKAIIIQSRFRRNFAVAQYQYNRCRVLLVSAMIRMYLARLRFRKVRKQVMSIQKCYRLLLFIRLLADSNRRRVLKRRNDSATLIQSKARMLRAQRLAKRMRSNQTRIQLVSSKWFRMMKCRRGFIDTVARCTLIASLIRRFLAKRAFQRSIQASVKIQARMRLVQARNRLRKCHPLN